MSVKVFVGNLPEERPGVMLENELKAIFARVAGVVSLRVMRDKLTNRSRGYGFVEVMTPEDGEASVQQLNGTEMNGRRLRVEKATPPTAAHGPRRRGRRGGKRHRLHQEATE